jgi:hypothetical protein
MKKWVWIVGGLIVVAGGIGAYFLLKKPKEDENGSDDDFNYQNPPSGQQRFVAPKELNTKAKIESFQNYVVNTKNDKAILGSAGVDGIWGRNTQNAWDKYGSDYLKTLNTSTTISSNPEFQKALNEAKDKNKTAFIWANQVYRTKTGERVMNYNPLIFNLITSRSGNVRNSPSASASSTPIAAGVRLGKGSDVVYNEPYLFIRFGSATTPMWIASTLVEKATISSFTGGEENWEVLDGKFDLNI